MLLLVIGALVWNCSQGITNDSDKIVRIESAIVDFVLEDISIEVGTTVEWINIDKKVHTVTSGISPEKSGVWDSTFLKEGERFNFLFMEVGKFNYWCRVHPFMTATVTVANEPA